MIVHDCVQNTPAWRQLRAGIPTASAFDRIITKTGKRSAQAEKYKFHLLGERILGYPLDDFKFTWAMERGSALERKAVEYYEFESDETTSTVGFITDDSARWGASLDRLVSDAGCLEIKCPAAETHLMYLMHLGSGYEEYKVQAQGQLWVAERDWVDFLSYHPDLPWSLVRVRRDEKFISKLSAAIEKFSDELEALSVEAQNRGWFRESSIRVEVF